MMAMEIDNQARESITAHRQHQEQRADALETRAKAEAQQPPTDSDVSEEARADVATQRQKQEAQRARLQRRAHDE
jgi:hypothetical protein